MFPSVHCSVNRQRLFPDNPAARVDRDGLRSIENELTGKVLAGWLSALDVSAPVQAEVSLPKLKFENPYDLVHQLKELGITSAFEAGKADFAPMGCDKGELYVVQVVHRACLAIDEQGTVAEAATAIEFSYKGMAPPPETFRADHPFLFLIRDKASGAILFMGRVSDPIDGSS